MYFHSVFHKLNKNTT